MPQVPFTFIHLRHPDRHTYAPTCMTVAPDTLQLSTNYHPLNPTQSEATLIVSNFGSHPFTKLKMHPLPQSHWLPQAYLLIYWCVKYHP